jgi:penicillin-binding protein 2
LSGEDPGLLPSPEWLRLNRNEKWSQGQTANTSIGQGYVLASPLQMAMIAATVANGGTVYKPNIIYGVQQPDGTMVRRPEKIRGDLRQDNNLTKDEIELVRRGMWRVVNDPGGTGSRAKVAGIVVAGKTGTAQFWRDGKKDNHTWFIAFAPYDNPKIALAILVQGAKAGGQVPAPIAAKLIEEIMALDKGYDPGVKSLDPAIGNFKFVETVDFKDSDVPPQVSGEDDETVTNDSPTDDVTSKKSKRTSGSEPDIRPDADDHHNYVKPQPTQQVQVQKKKSFFDFFRKKPDANNNQQQQQQPQEKKKRFWFF